MELKYYLKSDIFSGQVLYIRDRISAMPPGEFKYFYSKAKGYEAQELIKSAKCKRYCFNTSLLGKQVLMVWDSECRTFIAGDYSQAQEFINELKE